MIHYTITPLGDSALSVELGKEIGELTHQIVQAFVKDLEKNKFTGLVEYVPAFTKVAIYYDPVFIINELDCDDPYHYVEAKVEKILKKLKISANSNFNLVEIPVCYGGGYGPDLSEVAGVNGITEDEVIKIHSSTVYLVHMVGFSPGFPYLGGLDEKIATPRRSSPRLSIPAGSVGIGGSQTGVYPVSSPGGWQIIGQTPKALFDVEMSPPSFLQNGDRVVFRPISIEEFEQWKQVAE